MHFNKQREDIDKKTIRNAGYEMSRGEFLSALVASFFIAGLCSINGMVAFADLPEKSKNKLIAKAGEVEPQDFPTRENPVVVEEKVKKVLGGTREECQSMECPLGSCI